MYKLSTFLLKTSFYHFRSLSSLQRNNLKALIKITKNHTDSIIVVMGDSIKCEGERQKQSRYIIVSRLFRFLSSTKLNRYEQAVYGEAHTIQPLCLKGVRNLFLTPFLRLWRWETSGSNRCPITTIMKISVSIRSNRFYMLLAKKYSFYAKKYYFLVLLAV